MVMEEKTNEKNTRMSVKKVFRSHDDLNSMDEAIRKGEKSSMLLGSNGVLLSGSKRVEETSHKKVHCLFKRCIRTMNNKKKNFVRK